MEKKNKKRKNQSKCDFSSLEEYSNARILSLITMFAKRRVRPSKYYNLLDEAKNRGLDLDNPYKFMKEEEGAPPERLQALGLGDSIVLGGRTDIDGFFTKSPILSGKKLSHTPFLVFVELDDSVRVDIIETHKKLLSDYSDETKVMAQWQGGGSSHYFQFKVKDVRGYLEKKKIVSSFNKKFLKQTEDIPSLFNDK